MTQLMRDDRFLAPLWAVTYPPGTREVMLGRHKHVASSHALNKKCKEAAAAMCEFDHGFYGHADALKISSC